VTLLSSDFYVNYEPSIRIPREIAGILSFYGRDSWRGVGILKYNLRST